MPRRRPIGPFLALALLLGLGAWVGLKEFHGGGARPKDEGRNDRPLPFERADLKAIRIRNDHGDVRLEKKGEAWSITDPLPTEADKEAVDGLIGSLETARVQRRLGPAADLKTYGLDPPKAIVTLDLASSAPRELRLGDGSPVGGTFFALPSDGKEVVLVTSALGDLAKKDLLALRDKSLLVLDPWKVKRLSIERGREKVLLEKPDDGWKLRSPVEAPADGPTITDLLSALERLRATSFVTEKPDAKDLKRQVLDPPSAKMTILQEGWDVEKTVLLGRKPDGTLTARTVGRDPIIEVSKDFWEKVATKIADLRRKEILGVGQYRLESITAGRDGGPALVLARQKDGSWKASGRASGTITSESIDTLLQTLGNLKAASFEDKPAEALRVSLARRPALELTLLEEADASGKAKSQHLVFGAPDRAGMVRVRDMAWRPIALVPASPTHTIGEQLDKLVRAAQESAKPSPSPSGSPGPLPGPSASPSGP